MGFGSCELANCLSASGGLAELHRRKVRNEVMELEDGDFGNVPVVCRREGTTGLVPVDEEHALKERQGQILKKIFF